MQVKMEKVKSTEQNMTKRYFVGVDGGATQCRASLFDANGRLLGKGVSGPANPANGIESTQDSIQHAITQSLVNAHLSELKTDSLVVGAGLAGLHLPSLHMAMAQWSHPYAELYLTTDLHAALLGAHGGEDGGVIILGTGFSALGKVAERQIPIGGYGFPIYATCSGSWFGLELIKAVLLDADGIGPSTALTTRVLQDIDIISLAEKMNNAPAQAFATYAPLVFEYAAVGDLVAKLLIEQGAEFINKVLHKLITAGVNKVSFIGGVAPYIQAWLDEKYSLNIVPAQAEPELGVMLWARQQSVISNNN
jgi:glucosamine kinase